MRNRDLVKKARVLRSSMTLAEILLWSRIRSKQVDGFKFRRQQPLYNYIVDFYCHELKLIVEIDGVIHSDSKQADYDKNRDKIFKINGFHVLHLSNHEIVTDLTSAVDKLRNFISTNLSSSKRTAVNKPAGNKVKSTDLSPSRGTSGGVSPDNQISAQDLSPFRGTSGGAYSRYK